jgi:hypothetical protein
MSEQQDYMDQMEHYNLTKEAGIDAYAEALSKMLPNVDADKRILIMEGIKASLGSPPPMRFPVPPMPKIDVVPPPSHIFEQTNNDGSVTVFDWFCLASLGTHSTRYADGKIEIWRGMELVIGLNGEAAEKFWEWKNAMMKQTGTAIPVYLPRL